MPNQQELERSYSIVLAALCQEVADDPSRYTQAVAEEALKLRTEWAALQLPPRPTLKEERRMQSKQVALKTRMVEFLAGIL
jgi:hypothetical protein